MHFKTILPSVLLILCCNIALAGAIPVPVEARWLTFSAGNSAFFARLTCGYEDQVLTLGSSEVQVSFGNSAIHLILMVYIREGEK